MKFGKALVIVSFILVNFSLFAAKTGAAASVFYVDGKLPADCASGNYSIANRSCQGTDGNAFRTINVGINAAGAGDTLLVRGGTYREFVLRSASPVRSASFYITKSITIKGYQAEDAVLTYDPGNLPREDNDKGPIILIEAPNVTLEHLIIIGTRQLGDNAKEDTDINIWLSNSPNTVIRNNRIYDAGHAGIKQGGPGLIVEFNEFANIGFTQRDQGIYTYDTSGGAKIIRYNDFHNITGYGIQLYSYARNYQVYGNIIHDNGEGGIILAGDHLTIVNNVIYGNGKTSVSQYGGQGGMDFFHAGMYGLTIKNNIIWGNAAADLNCSVDSPGQGGNVFANNLVGTGIDGCNQGNNSNFWNRYATNTISEDPQFVNPSPSSWADFRLKPTSPAIGKGINAGAAYRQGLSSAVNGWFPGLAARSSGGWDIGAFVAQPGQ